jgi:cytoskeletal protein CcmA (bactofilin family)
MSTALWYALLALGAVAMLGVPFVPAWSEWRRPTDAFSLPVPSDYASEVDYFARQLRERMVAAGARTTASLRLDAPRDFDAPLYVSGDVDATAAAAFTALLAMGDIRLGPGSQVTQWVHADGALTLGEGSVALRRASCGGVMTLGKAASFERLHASTILFGEAAAAPAAARPTNPVEASALPEVTCRIAGLFRADGDLSIPAGSRFEGSLVVTGALSIGDNTTVVGDVKARKGIVLGRGAAVRGAMTCERNIHVLEGARVKGPLVAEADIWLAPGVTVGTVGLPTTVTAQNIMVAEGVTAHGTVWAREAGVVWPA